MENNGRELISKITKHIKGQYFLNVGSDLLRGRRSLIMSHAKIKYSKMWSIVLLINILEGILLRRIATLAVGVGVKNGVTN